MRLSTSLLSGAEAGGSNSKNARAFPGRRMALMPKPRKMVPKTVAAMRRQGDWEKLFEGAMSLEGWDGSVPLLTAPVWLSDTLLYRHNTVHEEMGSGRTGISRDPTGHRGSSPVDKIRMK